MVQVGHVATSVCVRGCLAGEEEKVPAAADSQQPGACAPKRGARVLGRFVVPFACVTWMLVQLSIGPWRFSKGDFPKPPDVRTTLFI